MFFVQRSASLQRSRVFKTKKVSEHKHQWREEKKKNKKNDFQVIKEIFPCSTLHFNLPPTKSISTPSANKEIFFCFLYFVLYPLLSLFFISVGVALSSSELWNLPQISKRQKHYFFFFFYFFFLGYLLLFFFLSSVASTHGPWAKECCTGPLCPFLAL